MAAGDTAAAAGMAIYTGNEDAKDLWKRDNEILDQVAIDRTAVRSVARGGTGGNTPPTARAALGIRLGNSDLATVGDPGSIPVYNAAGQLTSVDPTASGHVATAQWVIANFSSGGAYVNKSGDTMSGQLFLPASYAANFSWTVAYINGDGRVSRGASSARYKKYIHDAGELGDLFTPALREYQMRAATTGSFPGGEWHLGNIAEELVGTDAERFVIYSEEGPESIDWIALGMAREYQLHRELGEARERIARLEEAVELLLAREDAGQ